MDRLRPEPKVRCELPEALDLLLQALECGGIDPGKALATEPLEGRLPYLLRLVEYLIAELFSAGVERGGLCLLRLSLATLLPTTTTTTRECANAARYRWDRCCLPHRVAP